MGIIKRQASKSSITSLIGILVSASSAVFVIPMIPEEVYGMVSVVIGIASLLLPLTLVGLNSTLLRYSETINQEQKEFFFKKLYLTHTFFSIVISVIFYLISGWFFEKFYPESILSDKSGFSISLLLFLMGQFTMLSAYATSKYRLNVTRIAEFVFQKTGIPLLFVAFAFGIISINLIIPGLLVLYFFRSLSLWIFRRSIKTNSGNEMVNVSATVKIWPYSFFALFAVLLHQAIIDIDTLMVGSLVGLGEAGIYKYAFYIGMIVDLPRLNLVSLLFPLISKYQLNNDRNGIDSVYKRSSNLLFVLGGFILVTIIPNLGDFFNIIPNGKIFEHGKYVIIFIALAKLFNMVMGVNFEIIASSKSYYIILFINLFTLGVVILSNSLLIPIYGVSGAAFATLLVWIVYNIAAYLYLKIAYKYSPFSRDTLKIAALLGLFMLSFHILPIETGYSLGNIIFRSLLSILFLVLCYKMRLSIDFNSQCLKALTLLKLIKNPK